MGFMNVEFWLLVISIFSILFMIFYVNKRNKKDQINKVFFYALICIFIMCFGVIAQSIGYYIYNIDPLYFEYFIYIGTCFLPITIFFMSLIFANTKIKFKKSYIALFIIPIITLIIIWTNNYHHLFFVNYSFNLNEIITGGYYNIFSIFNTVLYVLSLINFLRYSIKNSGFFSKQAVLFIIAFLIPYGVNALGSFGIINISVYMTPILFTVTILLCAFAIFKFDFLSVTPIAMQRVVDRMSDSFIVISEDGIITDFNDTFLKTFNLKAENVRNISFTKFLEARNLNGMNTDFVDPILEKCKTTEETTLVRREMKINNKYFNIEASGIFSKNAFLGTLMLFKDVTQHVIDKSTIENNQNILMERERLASLGQLIGGIAHNLKTPIMSIAGAAEGLTDLIKEYEASVRRSRSNSSRSS